MKQLINKLIPRLYGAYFNLTHVFSKDKAADKALQVFSFPRAGKINPTQAEYLKSARQQRIAFKDGLIMLYHWQGDGPTVLMNHGWESNAWRWKHMIEPLKELGFNIIAIDAPAHGASDGKYFTAVKYSRVIKTVMDLYEPEIVIAHSVGAMATVFQEANEPHKFLKKLVLLGSPNSLEVIMRGYQNLTGFNSSVYNSLNELLQKTFDFKIEEFNTADFAAQLKIPTLIIHNPDDKIVPIEAFYQIKKKMPAAQTFVSPAGGHSLHTKEVVERVIQFLN
ncbi:MAG: alpha/beta hydrolase [Nonlabens sp.]